MSFLLDSNTFIEAKNRYYGMTFCPAYWDWLEKNYKTGNIASIDPVKEELVRAGDTLSNWIKGHNELFLTVSDPATQQRFIEVLTYLQSQKHMKANAMGEFVKGADPWLIAKASVKGMTIVTHEAFDTQSKKAFKIPVVAKQFGVQCIDTFELLERFEAEFVLSA